MGVEQMTKLIQHYGLSTIHSFMTRIREHAHKALLDALVPYDGKHLKAIEHLDNGAELNVEITINQPNVIFDFSHTSGEQKDNFNATPAITTSAILYVLRLIANKDIPLNEGLLNTVEIKLPRNLLNPDFDRPASECPPVVGGNTETSQRLVDTLIKAFGLAGCSQGTMNNLLFGNQSFGYYETICGGTGAGNGFNGANAIHHHMTNTRITDPEIMELRYPVVVKEFSIRDNSGGDGKWQGGNGVIRKITFTKPVELTILSQHRNFAPYGMNDAEPGEKGTQWIEKSDGSKIALNGCESYSAEIGDTIVVNTPGGGGYGKAR
jgi:5-oxoprolinase (ATP-hydrolysing)